MAGRGRPKRYTDEVRCPNPLHRGSSTSVCRTRATKTGTRRIYRCRPLLGDPHYFTLVLSETKPVERAPQHDKPKCPLHPDSHVVRDGSYGKRSPLRRQRYRCYPNPKNKKERHSFVPVLARQHVHVGGETCSVCEELRGVHHGDPAVARQHSWPAKIVARGLDMLSAGSSYAEVSRWALRAEAAAVEEVERARKAAEAPEGGPGDAPAGELAELDARAYEDSADTTTTTDEVTTSSSTTSSTTADEPSTTTDAVATTTSTTTTSTTTTSTTTTTEPVEGAEGDDGASEESEPERQVKRRPRRTSVSEPRVVTRSDGKVRRQSRAAVEAKNTWHIAADWCEVFGPAIWKPIDDALRTNALQERARLDALKAAGKPLVRPQVLLIDDVPTYGRDAALAGMARRDKGFYLLSAAEVSWHKPDPRDPLTLPVVESEMRLVRAFPKSNTAAWRLLFDELGYAPDFIVADAGTGQYAAIRAHYPDTVFLPSTWHVARAIRVALTDVKVAHEYTPAGKRMLPELEEHLQKLSRRTVLTDRSELDTWWTFLLAWARKNGAPTEKLRKRRDMYLPRMRDAAPMLAAHPEVPISTGGLETLQRRTVEPLLAGRRFRFGNIERTNTLLDLAVARRHGAFDDLAAVTHRLRDDSKDASGWAPPLRAVSDPAGPTGRYSSLRDATLLNHLAQERGLS